MHLPFAGVGKQEVLLQVHFEALEQELLVSFIVFGLEHLLDCCEDGKRVVLRRVDIRVADIEQIEQSLEANRGHRLNAWLRERCGYEGVE